MCDNVSVLVYHVQQKGLYKAAFSLVRFSLKAQASGPTNSIYSWWETGPVFPCLLANNAVKVLPLGTCEGNVEV
jgi:hypothetical protein